MSEKKIIRIVSEDVRYRKEPYPCIPVENDRLGTYITGQHIIPNDPSTHDNLTVKQMLGEEKLTPEQRKRFPYIIIPEVRVPLVHLRPFNMGKNSDGSAQNPKDVAEFDLFQLQTFVAQSKDKYTTGQHTHYIEDKESEAMSRITKRELRFKAEKLIRENTSVSAYVDIALLLNYKIEQFRVNVDAMSLTIIQDKLFDICDTHPDKVLECFDRSAKDDLFILKALHFDIITREGKSFYDGGQYLGDTTDAVKEYFRTEEGERFFRRISSLVAKRENKRNEIANQKANDNDYEDVLKDCMMAIIDSDYFRAQDLYEQLLIINPKGKELDNLKFRITSIREAKERSEKLEKAKKELTGQNKVDANESLRKNNEFVQRKSEYRADLESKDEDELKTFCGSKKYKKTDWKDLNKEELVEFLMNRFK